MDPLRRRRRYQRELHTTTTTTTATTATATTHLKRSAGLAAHELGREFNGGGGDDEQACERIDSAARARSTHRRGEQTQALERPQRVHDDVAAQSDAVHSTASVTNVARDAQEKPRRCGVP
jgi:hypothetical protein